MTKPRLPRWVETAAAVFAAAMFMFVFVPNASAQRVGCLPSGANAITAHGFCDGTTDIRFPNTANDFLFMPSDPQAPRIIFNHSSPLSYNSATYQFKVQAVGGSTENYSEWNPRVNIGALVDNSGKLMSESAIFTCGTDSYGNPIAASFCVQGEDGTVWLRGQVKGFAHVFNSGAVVDPNPGYGAYDDFAFYVQITGGSRKFNYGNFMAVSVHGFAINGLGPAWNGSFTQPVVTGAANNCLAINPDLSVSHTDCSFGGGILGVMGLTNETSMLADMCDGTISGTVKNGLLNSPMAGDQVTLTSVVLAANQMRISDAEGRYNFTGLCQGNYTVSSDVPDGFAPADLYPTTRPVTFVASGSGNNVPSVAGANVVNFVFYPIISSDYKTWGQGGWGAKPSGNNAGALLQNYYGAAFGNDPVVIGTLASGKYASLFGAVAVQSFLPQGGKPAAFDGAYTNPLLPSTRLPTNKLGTLAGQTMSLKLNVEFSASGLTRVGFGSLFVASGPMANCSVNQVLTYANSVLGGEAIKAGIKPEDATDTAGKINGNYEGGKGKGYLKPASGGACPVQ